MSGLSVAIVPYLWERLESDWTYVDLRP